MTVIVLIEVQLRKNAILYQYHVDLRIETLGGGGGGILNGAFIIR